MAATKVGIGSGAGSAETAAQDACATALGMMDGAAPGIALIFASPDHNLLAVSNAVSAALPASTQTMGCSTAGELTTGRYKERGIVVVLIANDQMEVKSAFTGKLTDAPDAAAKALLAPMTGAPKDGITVTFMDALGGQSEAVVERMRAVLGVAHQIVGGAAGDDGKLKRTYVSLNGQSSSDAAAALHISGTSTWGVGCDHGFSPATPMMRVTRAKGTKLYELDNQPAIDVFKAYARKSGQEFTERDSSTFLINNELGVYVLDRFRKARAPLVLLPDGGLACAAPVTEGSIVAILKSDERSLLGAADAAAREAKARLRGREAAGVLVFDCVCRKTIMGKGFPKELEAVRAVFPNVPVAGFVTYGEIARYSGQLDGWHNASVVVTAIPS